MQQALAEPEPSAKKVVQNLAMRDKMRASLLREMEQYPVILMPPCGIAAFRHRQRRFETPAKTIGLFEAMMPATPVTPFGWRVSLPMRSSRGSTPIRS